MEAAKSTLMGWWNKAKEAVTGEQAATAEAHGEYTGYAPSSPAPAPAPAGPMNIGGRRRKHRSRKGGKKGGRRHTARK